MPSRHLNFPVFDADNHFYETRESFSKFLPDDYEGLIRYIDIEGRTKIVVKGTISEYIPNPTFDVVAAPGAQEDYYRHGNPEGKSYREIMGEPIRSTPAFREPGARLELMDEQGVERTLMFPTLASLVEQRLKDDPEAIHAIIVALNRWMHETWTFNYEERIFPTPVITMCIVEKALEELEWVIEQGARCVLIRPAPVPGWKGTRSPGLPEFDPVWKRICEAGLLVGMHASDSGYAEFVNTWEPTSEFLPFNPTPFRMIVQGKRPIEDTMTALVCHGALTRHPDLRIACVETGGGWVGHLLHNMADTYRKMPQMFPEDPVEAFKRCIYVNPFWEDSLEDLIDLVGIDHVMFGSDYPHPEGLADPITYVDELEGFSEEDRAKIMGGNLGRLMGVDDRVAVS